MTNNIIQALEEGNRWWKGAFELDFHMRDVYLELQKYLPLRQIIALMGLRRVGKTTILLKVAADSIKGFGADNVAYFSFDDFGYVKVNEVLRAYGRLLNKNIDKGKFLFLFDEIQKVEGWQEQVKRIYDLHPNIKIIISGSESLFIRKRSRESLAGRIFEFRVEALSFKEYLSFRGKKYENKELYREELLREFTGYLCCSGFPEMAGKSPDVVKKYIKELVIEKIIYKDIPAIFHVEEPAILESLYSMILEDPGEIVEIDSVANDLTISRQTASLYLSYLEQSFLIKKLYNYSRNARKTQRKLKKYYPTILSPALVEKSDKFGKVFEAAMVIQLQSDFFWRDTYKNEVDAIKVVDGQVIPVEIKVKDVEVKPLLVFMRKFKIKEGIVLTYEAKGTITKGGFKIEVVPFYEYFLP